MKMLPGVDASSFQGPPGTWMAEAGDIAFAAVKISELSAAGSYVNPDALADLAALKARGLGRICYLFGHPAMGVTPTVDLFLSATGPVLMDTDMVALDLEVTDGLGPAAVSAWGLAVLRLLKHRLDRQPLIYTFISFAQDGNCDGLGGFPLWIADPSSAAGKPFVPPPWRTFSVHQFSIAPPVDRDLAVFASLKDMRVALGKHVPKPRRKDNAMPVLLNKGAGAITPYSVPAGAVNLVLTPTSTATVDVQTHDHGTQRVELEWQPPGGEKVPIPAGVQFLHLHRVDGGTDDVSVEWE